jgi:hypothetical protein
VELRAIEATPDLAELELAHLSAERTYRSWFQEHALREQDHDLWEEERQRLRAILREREQQYREAQAALPSPELPTDTLTLRQVWDDADTATRRERFLRHEFDVVFVRPGGKGRPDVQERVKILWRGEGPGFRGRVSGPTEPFAW